MKRWGNIDGSRDVLSTFYSISSYQWQELPGLPCSLCPSCSSNSDSEGFQLNKTKRVHHHLCNYSLTNYNCIADRWKRKGNRYQPASHVRDLKISPNKTRGNQGLTHMTHGHQSLKSIRQQLRFQLSVICLALPCFALPCLTLPGQNNNKVTHLARGDQGGSTNYQNLYLFLFNLSIKNLC